MIPKMFTANYATEATSRIVSYYKTRKVKAETWDAVARARKATALRLQKSQAKTYVMNPRAWNSLYYRKMIISPTIQHPFIN
jgi:hypothetical protein